MTHLDIVERLRGKPVRHDYVPEADRQEAAAEIERLRESCIQIALDKDVIIERLRAVLQTIADQNSEHWAKSLARRALEPKP